ncbi:YjzD family protein [Aeribacillus pallidus]|uniref:YjzD family protein n=1 Tax=Aeribacillus pallidus TaxID=33936 RepID=UPI001D3FD1E5|nr:YjzD family protein [Bacillus sp. (in: firmicutes)]
MRYLATFFWAFLLVQMLSYVVSSMMGAEYHFETGALLAVIATVLIYVVPTILPNDPVEKH